MVFISSLCKAVISFSTVIKEVKEVGGKCEAHIPAAPLPPFILSYSRDIRREAAAVAAQRMVKKKKIGARLKR